MLGMPAEFVVAPPAIVRVDAPYERLEPLARFPLVGPADIKPGTIWLVVVPASPNGWPTAADWVLWLRSAYASVTIGLLLPEDAAPLVPETTSAAGAPRVRAVLRHGEPIAPTLRDRLTRPVGLGAEVTDWLGLRGLPLPPRVAAPIRALFDDGGRTMARALEPLSLSERTLRRYFARRGLPPPREWHAAARALRAVLCLQREPTASLLDVSFRTGYGDHSSLSRQIKRLFNLRPGEIRRTLGWEWVLERWVRGWDTAPPRVVTRIGVQIGHSSAKSGRFRHRPQSGQALAWYFADSCLGTLHGGGVR